MPPTMAEREAELAALQSAFDEYIASSRELEEELDAELAKMQEKLADSSAANAALSAQLENIAPQLAALEKALSESRNKLKEEQKLRRQAEQAQDELEAKFREAEGSLLAVREECDAVHEELAFKESELEETRLELEIEKEKHRVEMEDAMENAGASGGDEVKDEAKEEPDEDADLFPTVDDAYVKKLEDELELVTEQLIETEARLSQTEEKLAESEEKAKAAEETGPSETSEEDKSTIKSLQEEVVEKSESETKLREELELTKEELSLTQEELKAVEFDATEVSGKLDTMRAEHREEVNKLKNLLNDQEIEAKVQQSGGDQETFEKALAAATKEAVTYKDEVDNLNTALENAKADHAAVVNELEEVQQRFDEVRAEAEKRGKEAAVSEVREELKAEREAEVSDFKEQLKKANEEKAALQQKINETEIALASAKDGQAKGAEVSEEQSELVKQLQSQLATSKDNLAAKETEMSGAISEMEGKVSAAEEKATKLESELSNTKSKLSEAEANLIIIRREKEIADAKDIQKANLRKKREQGDGTAKYRSELIDMDEVQQVTRRRRYRSNSPNNIKRLEIKIEDEQKKYKELEKEFEKQKDQKRIGDSHIKRLEEDIKVLQQQLYQSGDVGTKTDMSRLSSLGGGSADGGLGDDKSKVQEVIESGDVEKMKTELLALDKKVAAQRDYNNQLLSKMLALQGNIQVFCRIRPMSIKEIQSGYKTVVESLSESELGCFDSRTQSWKSFAFDRVWGPDQSQQNIFQDVEPIALSVVDGFNACIFAYGQTGSGKTYTMEGAEENNQRGISYRTIQKVFTLLSMKKQQEAAAAILMKTTEERDEEPDEFVFEIKVGMLEIYNDECYDLLGAGGSSLADKKKEAQKAGGKASLEIRRNQDGRIEVPNLTKENVENIQDVIDLLKRGNKNRAVGATSLNSQSSRSHMVLWVDVKAGMKSEGGGNSGTLFLVDLAGSERVKKSEVEGGALKEASHINKSLSALGNVMEALDRKAAHVPYRDSKLTFLLQDSLGGNSRTMMVVAVTPVDYAYDESIHALQFATRVRRINIGAAQRNVTSKNLEETVKALTAEMKTLTRQKQKTDSQLNSLKKDNSRIQGKLGKLDAARKAAKSDNKTLEVLRKNNDDMAKRWQKEKSAREAALEEAEKANKELRKLQKSVAKLERDQESLKNKLDEKDKQLEKKATELRTAKEAAAASNIRARKAQVLGSRAEPKQRKQRVSIKDTPAPASAAATPPEEVKAIREKVLALLQKHDQSKVNRIDIIMEKFKGKESLLLEKMTQRYESGTAANDAKTRSEAAAKRHMERMKKLREKKGLK